MATKEQKRLLSLKEKNEFPETYGYQHWNDIPGNEKGVVLVPFISFPDFDGDTRYYPCDEETFKFLRNDRRKEEQYYDRQTRCLVPSKKFGLKTCMEKCDECPLELPKRISKTESMDYMHENYNFDYANENEITNHSTILTEKNLQAVEEIEHALTDEECMYLENYKNGYSDSKAAKEKGVSRSTYQNRREKLFKSIRKQLEDFD